MVRYYLVLPANRYEPQLASHSCISIKPILGGSLFSNGVLVFELPRYWILCGPSWFAGVDQCPRDYNARGRPNFKREEMLFRKLQMRESGLGWAGTRCGAPVSPFGIAAVYGVLPIQVIFSSVASDLKAPADSPVI